MPPIYLFVHIPKTGGQTLRDHFISCLQFHKEFIHLGPYGIEDAEQRGMAPFAARPVEERKCARVILGHYVDYQSKLLVPGKSYKHIVFLRDPAERMVSLYNFTMEQEYRRQGKPPVPFEVWWPARKHQTSVWWICREFLKRNMANLSAQQAFDIALETLEEFWFVGTMETYQQDTGYLLKQMHLPELAAGVRSNVTGEHFERTLRMNDRIRALIHRECGFDVALHQHFLNRRRAQLESI